MPRTKSFLIPLHEDKVFFDPAPQVEKGHPEFVSHQWNFCEVPPLCLKEPPLFIEACCGCALLNACVKQCGFEVLPIDFYGNKHRPFVHVVELDLRKASAWDFLYFLVRSRKPFFFHAAPPCGTASRARDRRLSKQSHRPPPLRSDDYPLGFPWLKGVLRAKVLSANQIYINLAKFLVWFNLFDIHWSVENQARATMRYFVNHFILWNSIHVSMAVNARNILHF